MKTTGQLSSLTASLLAAVRGDTSIFKPLRPISVALAILLSANPVIPQLPGQMEKAIALKAIELKLGDPRSETPRPRQIGPPRTDVWWQAFNTGRVYWTPQAGAHFVAGDILSRWMTHGGEKSSLGFPVTDEAGCAGPDPRDRFQKFEHGAIHWRGATRETAIYSEPVIFPSSFVGQNFCSPAEPPDSAGLFRVILTGFAVNRQTNDNILETDGKGDEVYIVAEVAQYDSKHRYNERSGAEHHVGDSLFRAEGLNGRGNITQRYSLTSIVMGDANSQDVPRIRAGTAGEAGGLRTTDRYPTNQPWLLTGTPSRNRVPMLLWQGELRRDHDLVIIIPTIWEWDGGNPQLRAQFHNDANWYLTEGTYRDSGYVSRSFTGGDVAGAGDRPIGMLAGDTWVPAGIKIDFETAVEAVSQNRLGPGVFEIRYAAETEDYSLYFKIERLK